MEKNKKNINYFYKFKKKIDTSAISTGGKNHFLLRKKTFKTNKNFKRSSSPSNLDLSHDNQKKNFARKFIEQQATKDFIKRKQTSWKK